MKSPQCFGLHLFYSGSNNPSEKKLHSDGDLLKQEIPEHTKNIEQELQRINEERNTTEKLKQKQEHDLQLYKNKLNELNNLIDRANALKGELPSKQKDEAEAYLKTIKENKIHVESMIQTLGQEVHIREMTITSLQQKEEQLHKQNISSQENQTENISSQKKERITEQNDILNDGEYTPPDSIIWSRDLVLSSSHDNLDAQLAKILFIEYLKAHHNYKDVNSGYDSKIITEALNYVSKEHPSYLKTQEKKLTFNSRQEYDEYKDKNNGLSSYHSIETTEIMGKIQVILGNKIQINSVADKLNKYKKNGKYENGKYENLDAQIRTLFKTVDENKLNREVIQQVAKNIQDSPSKITYISPETISLLQKHTTHEQFQNIIQTLQTEKNLNPFTTQRLSSLSSEVVKPSVVSLDTIHTIPIGEKITSTMESSLFPGKSQVSTLMKTPSGISLNIQLEEKRNFEYTMEESRYNEDYINLVKNIAINPIFDNILNTSYDKSLKYFESVFRRQYPTEPLGAYPNRFYYVILNHLADASGEESLRVNSFDSAIEKIQTFSDIKTVQELESLFRKKGIIDENGAITEVSITKALTEKGKQVIRTS